MKNNIVNIKMYYECIFSTNQSTTVVMTVFAANCTDSSREYTSYLHTCHNAQTLFPDDPQWGPFDWYDSYKNGSDEFTRTFYKSTNGTCTTPSETFSIPINVKVGPMGDPRPCGIFHIR